MEEREMKGLDIERKQRKFQAIYSKRIEKTNEKKKFKFTFSSTTKKKWEKKYARNRKNT